MLVDLDSRDLIRLEHDEAAATTFRETLLAAGARLVVSDTVLDEIIEPLRRRAEGSSVMKLLIFLETLPLIWIRTVDIETREVERAVRCFVENRTYEPVDQLFTSYADIFLGLSPQDVAYHRRRPLAATIWDLVAIERTMPARASIRSRYPSVVQRDRDLVKGWTEREYRDQCEAKLEEKIVVLVRERRLDRHVEVSDFAAHVRTHLEWCPSARLSFGAWHVAVYDTQSRPRDSELDDLTRLLDVPYVDVFTCDGARRDQLKRLRQSDRYGLRAWPHWERVHIVKDIVAVVDLLKAAADAKASGAAQPSAGDTNSAE